MIEKFLIISGPTVIALKYDDEKRILTLGSNIRFKRDMETILNEGFGVAFNMAPQYVQKNKIKYVYRKNKYSYENGLEWLRGNGYVVESVKNHGNVMR